MQDQDKACRFLLKGIANKHIISTNSQEHRVIKYSAMMTLCQWTLLKNRRVKSKRKFKHNKKSSLFQINKNQIQSIKSYILNKLII